MEINKQLFEDILSGKLKGTFVLRNGITVNDNKLTRNTDGCGYTHPYYPYSIKDWSYTPSGNFFGEECVHFPCESNVDVVDFIPETNMKENELTIEIPEGKIVDWDESKKQNKIVLKDKQLTYEDVCEKLFSKLNTYYFVNNHGSIYQASSICNPYISNPNSASTTHQLECILAKNKLANVAKYLNGEWEPYKTDLGHFDAWVLFATPNKDFVGYSKITDCAHNSNVLFRSPELAKQAVKILGEEIVKLALEPLGI